MTSRDFAFSRLALRQPFAAEMPPRASTSSTASTPASAATPGTALSVNQIIKLLTSAPCLLSTSQAVTVASKLIPAGFKTAAAFSGIQKSDLSKLEITETETVKKLLKLSAKTKSKPTKAKKGSDLDKPLPTGEAQITDDFDFKEILYLPALEKSLVVINKAPILALWAVIVSERLGFSREESLSLGEFSIYWLHFHSLPVPMADRRLRVVIGYTYKDVHTQKIYKPKEVQPIGDQPVIQLMQHKVRPLSFVPISAHSDSATHRFPSSRLPKDKFEDCTCDPSYPRPGDGSTSRINSNNNSARSRERCSSSLIRTTTSMNSTR